MEAEFRQVLLDLELLSNGRTQSWDGRVTGSKDRSPLMRLHEEPAHEVFARRWAEAGSEAVRATVLAEARATLRAGRYAAAPPRDSKPWQEIVGRSGEHPSDLAERYGITRQYAWQLQQRYGGRRSA